MGIFNFVKKEVKREFIARPDESKDLIIYKWPDTNIRMLTQLTVQPDEVALFIKKGEVVGLLDSGTHTLDGASIPFLSGLIDAATGGNFLISELYFVSTRQFASLPFGGMIDNVLDPTTNLAITIRLFGEYSLRVVDSGKLIINLAGTKNLYSNDEITEWIKQQILKVFREIVADYVSVEKKPVLGIASQASEFEVSAISKVKEELKDYGIEIAKLGNVTISIKEEDEAMLKQLTRDFAYANNAGAADVAVKLGMAEGLKSNSPAGQVANMGAGMMTGMGIGAGIGASAQPTAKPAPTAVNPQPTEPTAPVTPTEPAPTSTTE